MQADPLAIAGAFAITPKLFPDDRGTFFEWFRADVIQSVAGRDFQVRQANQSVSRRGVVRGIHFADVPPGQAKWVHCAVGQVLDVVVDLRVGSPSFGAVETVVLDDVDHRSVLVSEGLGHAFCCLSETATVSYLLTDVYRPGAEHGVNPLDPELGVDWPMPVGELVLSDKDRDAPTLAEAARIGLLPTFEECRLVGG